LDQVPGPLFYKTRTAKLNRTADLPAKIRDYTEKNYPLYMSAPTEWAEPNVSSYEVYMRDRTPAS